MDVATRCIPDQLTGGFEILTPKHTAEHPEVRLPTSNEVVSGPPPEVKSEAGAPLQNSETSRDTMQRTNPRWMRCDGFYILTEVWIPSS